jgi:hypothetical protein
MPVRPPVDTRKRKHYTIFDHPESAGVQLCSDVHTVPEEGPFRISPVSPSRSRLNLRYSSQEPHHSEFRLQDSKFRVNTCDLTSEPSRVYFLQLYSAWAFYSYREISLFHRAFLFIKLFLHQHMHFFTQFCIVF